MYKIINVIPFLSVVLLFLTSSAVFSIDPARHEPIKQEPIKQYPKETSKDYSECQKLISAISDKQGEIHDTQSQIQDIRYQISTSSPSEREKLDKQLRDYLSKLDKLKSEVRALQQQMQSYCKKTR